MVEIAKAVSYESDVLIMDEPTSALTEREVDHLFTIIRGLQGRGQRHHLHHPQDERAVRDRRRGSVFRDGKYIATNASTEVTRDEIIRMMVGREITQMFPKETVPIGEVVLSVKGLTPQGRLPRRLLRCPRRRDPRHCRAGRLGPLATSPKRSSA